jgi:hypothetical protein
VLITGLAIVVAIAAAVRSTWSPCGLSMLSTITPMTESSRGHRYGVTASWFVVGAALGGATLGLLAAGLAIAVGSLDLTTEAALGAGAVIALVTAASDLRPFGLQLPFHRRQVNEQWLGQYRAWVYGTGFGWQIGVGLATYVMTAAVYLMIALAALTGSPATAFGIALLFGTVRGLAVLLGARLDSREALVRFHRRFDQLAQPVRMAVIGVQFAVAAIAAGAAWGPVAPVVIGIAGVAALGALALQPAERRTPAPTP